MGREHDVGHARQRVIGGQPFADEVVEPCSAHLAVVQRIDQRVGVVQLSACGVEEDDAGAHRGELVRADHADGLIGDGCVQRDDVGLGEEFVETVVGLVVVRVVGDDRHAEPLQPPPQGTRDGAEAHQPRGSAGDLPCPESLVGNGAVAKHLPGSDIRVGGQHVAGGGEQQCDRHFRDRIGVAPGCVQHRYARRGRAGDVDVVGIPAGGGDGAQRQVEYRPAHRITLHDKDIGVLCGRPLRQLLGAIDPQRALLDPRVVDHVDQLPQFVETRTAQGCRYERAKSGHDCSCWRTVALVSAKDVTIGIDIGTTAVKAVAADEDGQVTARVRIPHRLRVPAPNQLEHDADEAWRQGPLTALSELRRPDAAAVAVTAMVPSLTAVDDNGRPLTPGLLYGDARGRSAAGPDTTFLSGEAVEFLRWTVGRGPRRARVLARDGGGQPGAGG